jgi:hypothetical protein
MQCQHKKRDGKRCRAAALTGQTRCAMHAQPGRAAELGSKGGRRRAVSSPGDLKEFATPKTAADLRELLAESIIEIRAGNLDPRIANALGYLGRNLKDSQPAEVCQTPCQTGRATWTQWTRRG